jgi:hypothetical protein
MEQQKDPAAPPVSTAQTKGAADQPPANNEAKSVSEERMVALEERINSLGRLIRLQTEGKQSQKQPDQAEGEPGTIREELATIKKQLRAKDEEVVMERKENSMASAISAHNITGDAAELLTDHIRSRYGSAIEVSGKDVHWDDPETGDRLTMQQLVAKVLKSKGDYFKPSVAPPSGRGMRPSQGNAGMGRKPTYAELTPEERSKLTPYQRANMVQEDLKRLGT